MDIISVINQKGGVGKTTTVHALGIGLMKKKKKVLFIDIDPQCNLSLLLKADKNKKTVLDIFYKNSDIHEVIQPQKNYDLIQADQFLAGTNKRLRNRGDEQILKNNLDKLKDKYDYVIIDTPPSLGILTINSLVASTGVLVPVQADLFSVQAIGQLFSTIRVIKTKYNKNLDLIGFLLTRHNKRLVLSRELTDTINTIAEKLNTTLFNTYIRDSISIRESHIKHMSIFEYSPKSNAGKDYKNFINEFIKRRKNK